MVGYEYPGEVLYELFIFGWQMKHPIAPALGCFIFTGAYGLVEVKVTSPGLPPGVAGSIPAESTTKHVVTNGTHQPSPIRKGRWCVYSW